MIHKPKQLKTELPFNAAPYTGFCEVPFEPNPAEIQTIQYWFLLTVMSGVGPVWVKGPAFKGYLTKCEIGYSDFYKAGQPECTMTITAENKDESGKEGQQPGTPCANVHDRQH